MPQTACTPLETEPDRQHPLGAIPEADAVNFSVFSRRASGVELLIFPAHDDSEPARVIRREPKTNETFHFWHGYVRGLEPGAHYAYRVDGPWDLANGRRFNRNQVLLDPYSRGNTDALWNRGAACGPEDNLATSMRSVVIDGESYDWEGDRPLNRPMNETIIYELHVRGFTRSETSALAHPGTFPGLTEGIPYHHPVAEKFILECLEFWVRDLHVDGFRFDEGSILARGEDGVPMNSINFITCHDGFTLKDLVSYNGKHNEANGEGNADGNNDNLSWNCGAEGPSDDASVESLRRRQIKNFAAMLMLFQGVPMICGGDEVRRSQGGNNNAYCQDNETSWFDWTLVEKQVEKQVEIVRFFRRMIAFRKAQPTIHRSRFFAGEMNDRGLADVAWHGCPLFSPGWSDPGLRVLAFTLGGIGDGADIHVMLNMDSQDLEFDVPAVTGREWYRWADTSLPAPDDIAEDAPTVAITGASYWVNARSVVILASR